MERQSATTVQRYVDLLSDAGFKAVFGEQRNKDVLMDMLNVLLPLERRVRDVTYATTELPGFSPFNKSVRLDLRCTGKDGTEFIVEVQCYRQRNLFNACCMPRRSMLPEAGRVTGRNMTFLQCISSACSEAMR